MSSEAEGGQVMDEALDQAVEMYQASVKAGVHPLTAASDVVVDMTGVSLADLHDALLARGLIKSYGA
jgi:hypothetical protein